MYEFYRILAVTGSMNDLMKKSGGLTVNEAELAEHICTKFKVDEQCAKEAIEATVMSGMVAQSNDRLWLSSPSNYVK